MYGYNLEEEDEYVHLTYIAATTGHQLLVPGYTLVNALPFLEIHPYMVSDGDVAEDD